ncbi:MAG: CoA-binding protein [Saprospiraceae bacterium]|nr:CoA-binding protein [Saprospiraceae bacterium]
MGKKTLVLGASPNPHRYSFAAVERLVKAGHETIAVGLRKGNINGTSIQTGTPPLENIDTLTLYVGAENQSPLYSYILSLSPKRIIFNPGTENAELARKAKEHGIETVYACTLVMLSLDMY